MHNSVGKKVDKVLRYAAEKMINKEKDEWPPVCGILIYQPKRPSRRQHSK